jgi:hypothetical protein
MYNEENVEGMVNNNENRKGYEAERPAEWMFPGFVFDTLVNAA